MSTIQTRLEALDEAIELGQGRFDDELVDRAGEVATRIRGRIGHGTEHTVVALAGATGSGKSSLFNALSGTDLARTGVTRPTTSKVQAVTWGPNADRLLDWLEIDRRHRHDDADPALDGLVLLDLPDHDSTALEHRVEVDRLVQLVDLFIWVVDPEKYADAALHDGYLKPLAAHGDVMLMVLNKSDRLGEEGVASCLRDIDRLLEADGLPQVSCIPVSATTGMGVGELLGTVAAEVGERKATLTRLGTDLGQAARDLGESTEEYRENRIDKTARNDLIDALSAAAGVPAVADAVAAAHRFDAKGKTGWPLTRWLRNFRADPLKRLHLNREGPAGGRPSLPKTGAIEHARVGSAVRSIADTASSGLADPWPELARQAPGDPEDLDDSLARAVGRADLGLDRNPAWWTLVSWLQIALITAAIVGGLWLLVLFVFSYFRLPEPPVPELNGFPWPTILIFGGLLLGLIVAALSRWFASIGAKRRARRARKRLDEDLGRLADERVIEPIQEELAVAGQIQDAISRAADGGSRRKGWR